MYINHLKEELVQPIWFSLYTAVRQSLHACYTRLRASIALIGWVLLGLGLIAVLVEVLASFPGWFGPIFFGPTKAVVMESGTAGTALKSGAMIQISMSGSDGFWLTVAPVAGAILLYIVLTVIQPRLFPYPERRVPYLLTIGAALLTVGIIIQHHFQFCIIVYAVAAHARVTFSKKVSWLVEALLLVMVLIILTVPGSQEQDHFSLLPPLPNTPDEVFYKRVGLSINDSDQLLLRIPMLGIQIGGTLQVFQASIWTLGLLCLHVYTGIGVHERSARRRSDALVKELTQAQEQLRAYALHAEELATMRERARVAREVHDTLAQGLAAIKMHLETGAKLFVERPDLAHKHIERARILAGEHLDETRNSILNLRADALAGRTLPSALAALAAAWRPAHHSLDGHATFSISGIAENDPFWLALPPALELACYRIVQESLSNATRHGRAHHIAVELSIENDELCLTITDDGLGFDSSSVYPCQKGSGFGILGMHERLKSLSGRLEIISASGAGTQVVAMIPLKAVHRVMALSGKR